MKSIHDFYNAKISGKLITMLTCYDATMAALLNTSEIDAVLVGDSVAMVVYGYTSTIHATIDMMCQHIGAVRRGGPDLFIVGDMPFLTHRYEKTSALEAAGRLMTAGADAVKIEGLRGHEETIAFLVQSGIPVMGHLGLTPQSVYQLGGYKVQGKTDTAAAIIETDAHTLENSGCFALVLECIPAPLASAISQSLAIPTIGIGAGAGCDGQILVIDDMLGLTTAFTPRHVRRFLEGSTLVQEAIQAYCNCVREKTFPSEKESFL